jgi:pimeloyl-ACP methyl ester carboxylesterase
MVAMRLAGLEAQRRGSGPPLLLMHGVGHRWQAWLPVLDELARHFDVVAVSLPGFGQSPPLATAPTVGVIADTIEAVLDELGWAQAHVAGNSLGGWLSLELARRGRALSVCAIAPAGLWRDARQRRTKALFTYWSLGARMLQPVVGIFRLAPVRTVALFGLFGKPWRIPYEVARDDLRAFTGPELQRTLAELVGRRFEGGREITVPITVVWCSLDPLFHSGSSDLSQLPGTVRVARLFGAGHVPMWDLPGAVAEVIRETAVWGGAGASLNGHAPNTGTVSPPSPEPGQQALG